jgi:hypothetical protein
MSDDQERGRLPPASGRDGGTRSCASRRADKAERVRRHVQIAALLGRGTPSGTIVTRIATEFEISDRQARADLAKVRDRWASEITKEEPHRRARLLGTLDTVIAGAISDRAWSSAVAGCRELARICGLDAPTKVVVSTPEVSADAQALLSALKLTNAQRLAEIDKLGEEIAKEERIADHRVEQHVIDQGDDHQGDHDEHDDDDDDGDWDDG